LEVAEAEADEEPEADELAMVRKVRESEAVVEAADEPVVLAVPVVEATELAVEAVDLVADELFVVDADTELLVETTLAAVLEPETVVEVGLEEMGNEGLVA